MLHDYLKLVIGLSIPHAFVRIWLTFALWRLKPCLHARKLAFFAVASSLLVGLDFWLVPTVVHVLTSAGIVLFMLYILFRSYGPGTILIVFISYTAISLVGDMIGMLLLQLVYGFTERKESILNDPLQFQSVYLPLAAALGWLAMYLDKRKFPLLQRLYQYLLNIKHNRMKEILLLTVFQAFLLGLLFAIIMDNEHRYAKAFYNLVVCTLVLLTFCALFYTIKLLVRIREDAVRQTQDVYVEEIGKMFTVIRGQRHDFLNHVQVMSSMLQMNKLDQLKAYMKELAAETHSVASVVSHASPALAAFVMAKKELALAKGISFTADIPAQLDVESSVKSIDFVKIVGNLVDNAFEESMTLSGDQRQVYLAIRRCEKGKLSLEVRNQGRTLTAEDIRLMLLPGYTTKTAAGHTGLGLAIVNERVQAYKGELFIRSSDHEGTVVQITFP
ncbi:sensor histidine kinase [Cohnella boryungensis]|uniref:histidine kinase n=1 Tax=Cohnella boryungensis TaxID=768479 RepID=A0ABV8SE72_9BACL